VLMTDRPTIVLVHGAWHGAWCWDLVAQRLRANGRDVVAVDLPGHGADDGAFTDLHGDADRVRAVLDSIEGDVVLVGHSYGGAVVTEAGVHPSVRRVVYLAAFCLEEGESCAYTLADDSEAQAISHEGRPNMATGFQFADDGTIVLTPEIATECFYQDCEPEGVAWAIEHLSPHPGAAFAWRATPSTYVVCTEDQGVHPELQRLMARRCTEVEEWPYGHSPFLADPDHVAARLDAVAGEAADPRHDG
jgi:pimeloyl-ACP methyl ester carboxylesterase